MEDTTSQALGAEALERLLQSEFVFVTGKGGVGKSTVSALTGLEAAVRGRRTLLVYPEGSPAAEELWNVSLTQEPQEVAPSLFAVAVHPEAAMRQYVGEVLGSTKLASILFHQRIAQGLLTGIPGPSDWAILGKAWSFTKSGVRDGKRSERPFDLVIMDAPSSGDGSGMLRVPQVILDLAPAARLRRDAEACLQLLRDKARTSIVFVTLVELLPIAETEENIAVMRDELSMPVGPIFVNQVMEPRLSNRDREVLLGRPAPDPTSTWLQDADAPDGEPTSQDVRSALCENASIFQATREKLQEDYLKRIRKWQVPLIELPLLPEEEVGKKALRMLQMALAAGR